MDVNGKTVVEGVTTEDASGADCVFEEDCDPKSLEEVEASDEKIHHPPNVESSRDESQWGQCDQAQYQIVRED